jgi:hypothetical protein
MLSTKIKLWKVNWKLNGQSEGGDTDMWNSHSMIKTPSMLISSTQLNLQTH